MPIVVDYTPAGAMMGTAYVAGQQRRADTQAAMDQKYNFEREQAQLNRGHEIAMQRTNNEMKLLDEQTQMQFAVAMQQQKVQAAMQMELSTWQREQQKLDMAIQSIEESDAWTPDEKSELVARAKAKWAGADIPDKYGQQSSTISNLLEKGQYFNGLVEQGKQMIAGGMSISDAQTVLSAQGVPKYILDKLDVGAQQTEKVAKLNAKLETVQKQLQNYQYKAPWLKGNYEGRYNPKTKKWDKQTPEDEKRVASLKKSEEDLLMKIEQAQSEEADMVTQNLGNTVVNETSSRIKQVGDFFDEQMITNPEFQKETWEKYGGDGEAHKKAYIEDTLRKDAEDEQKKRVGGVAPAPNMMGYTTGM
jgi:hypothetical protein